MEEWIIKLLDTEHFFSSFIFNIFPSALPVLRRIAYYYFIMSRNIYLVLFNVAVKKWQNVILFSILVNAIMQIRIIVYLKISIEPFKEISVFCNCLRQSD